MRSYASSHTVTGFYVLVRCYEHRALLLTVNFLFHDVGVLLARNMQMALKQGLPWSEAVGIR